MSKSYRQHRMVKVLISFDPHLLHQMEARCKSLRLNRSQYLRALAENDLGKGGDLTLKPRSTTYPAHQDHVSMAADETGAEYKTKKKT